MLSVAGIRQGRERRARSWVRLQALLQSPVRRWHRAVVGLLFFCTKFPNDLNKGLVKAVLDLMLLGWVHVQEFD